MLILFNILTSLTYIMHIFILQARAKHDTTNTAVAGCVTGGVLSARGKLLLRRHMS